MSTRENGADRIQDGAQLPGAQDTPRRRGRWAGRGGRGASDPGNASDWAPSSATQTVARFAHGSRVPGWDDAVDLSKDPALVPDPATTPVPEDLRADIEAHMALYPDHRSAALPALAAAQRVHGWCSPQALDEVACVMGLTPGYLSSVASFYDMLETEPAGRHSVYVCTNISCSLRGADEVYDALRSAAADDPDFNVRSFECLGACDIAPMASVDGVYVGPLTPNDAETLLDDVRCGRPVLADRQIVNLRCADLSANRSPAARAAAEEDGARTQASETADAQRAHVARAGAAIAAPEAEREGFGPSMAEESAGPPAAKEQAPETPRDSEPEAD